MITWLRTTLLFTLVLVCITSFLSLPRAQTADGMRRFLDKLGVNTDNHNNNHGQQNPQQWQQPQQQRDQQNMYANQYQQQQQQQGGPPPIPQRPQQGKRSVGYFTNWYVLPLISLRSRPCSISPPCPDKIRSIYSPAYLPSQIPHQNLTHLNYAFANVDPHTGSVVLSDSWADVEIRHPGQGGDDGGLLGNFGVLRSLKRSNRYVP
jgi:hypothetical protein